MIKTNFFSIPKKQSVSLHTSKRFSLNALNEFAELSERQPLESETVRTCHLLCERPGCYHSGSKTHVRDKILKLNPIHGVCSFSLNSAKFR